MDFRFLSLYYMNSRSQILTIKIEITLYIYSIVILILSVIANLIGFTRIYELIRVVLYLNT